MSRADLLRALGDPVNRVLAGITFGKNVSAPFLRQQILNRARTEAAKLGINDAGFQQLTNLTPAIFVDPRLNANPASAKDVKNRLLAKRDQLNALHQTALLSSGDPQLFSIASRLANNGLSPTDAVANAHQILNVLGQGTTTGHEKQGLNFFSDAAKVGSFFNNIKNNEIDILKRSQKGGPFGIIAPLIGGLFGAAIPGIAGGLIGGAIGGSADGLEGVLKGIALGGIGKALAPHLGLSSSQPANTLPGISTGVTTPAGGGAIVGTGAPGFGAGQAAKLTGLAGGAPLGASPLAVAGGAAPLPLFPSAPSLGTVQPLPSGQIPGTNITVGSTGGNTLGSVFNAAKRLFSSVPKSNNTNKNRSTSAAPQLPELVSPSPNISTPVTRAPTLLSPIVGSSGAVSVPSAPSGSASGAALPAAPPPATTDVSPPLVSAPGVGDRPGKVSPSGVLVNPVIPNTIFKGSGLIFPNL